jgi:hypothetical protein
MLTDKQREKFGEEGYILVPAILTADQVRSLRTFLRPKFDLPGESGPAGNYGRSLVLPFSRYREMRWLFFHEPTVRLLKSLLGDPFAAGPHDVVHLNGFGRWHKDTTSPELDGHTFHYQDNHLVVTVAYYLQDNTEEYGGGLDVQPGSHLDETDCFVAQRRKRMEAARAGLLQKTLRKLTGRATAQGEFALPDPTNIVSIPSKAGDLVIFNDRLNHRATPARAPVLPKDKEKIAIFDTYSRNNAHALANVNYERGRHAHLKDFSWTADIRQEAEALGIYLV